MVYFRQLADAALPAGAAREPAPLREYLRAMRFLYQKEFVAQRAPDAAGAVAALYRSRGLSTATVIEAGYLVHLGLGVVKSLEFDRRVRRVLIVGPGLDRPPGRRSSTRRRPRDPAAQRAASGVARDRGCCRADPRAVTTGADCGSPGLRRSPTRSGCTGAPSSNADAAVGVASWRSVRVQSTQ
jgi:hypothetical protein